MISTVPTKDQVLIPESLLKKRKTQEKTQAEREQAAAEKKKVCYWKTEFLDEYATLMTATNVVKETSLTGRWSLLIPSFGTESCNFPFPFSMFWSGGLIGFRLPRQSVKSSSNVQRHMSKNIRMVNVNKFVWNVLRRRKEISMSPLNQNLSLSFVSRGIPSSYHQYWQ